MICLGWRVNGTAWLPAFYRNSDILVDPVTLTIDLWPTKQNGDVEVAKYVSSLVETYSAILSEKCK